MELASAWHHFQEGFEDWKVPKRRLRPLSCAHARIRAQTGALSESSEPVGKASFDTRPTLFLGRPSAATCSLLLLSQRA